MEVYNKVLSFENMISNAIKMIKNHEKSWIVNVSETFIWKISKKNYIFTDFQKDVTKQITTINVDTKNDNPEYKGF